MKAFQICSNNSDDSEIVFAEDRNKARNIALHHDGFEYDAYTDIYAYRMKLLDGMEDYEPKDNYWLNDEIRTILVRDYGWHCSEPNEYEPCDGCCAKQYCIWKKYLEEIEE